jgi:hypothetical protein
MNRLEEMKQFLEDASQYVKTPNYFYENHHCEIKNETMRIHLDTKLICSDELSISYGKCPHCKTIFYHEEYETSTL